MNSINTYKYITAPASTLFAGESKRVVLDSIQINKITTGTITIKSDGVSGTTLGVIAVGCPQGPAFQSIYGTEIQDLAIVNSGTEDITVFYRNI